MSEIWPIHEPWCTCLVPTRCAIKSFQQEARITLTKPYLKNPGSHGPSEMNGAHSRPASAPSAASPSGAYREQASRTMQGFGSKQLASYHQLSLTLVSLICSGSCLVPEYSHVRFPMFLANVPAHFKETVPKPQSQRILSKTVCHHAHR